MLVVPDWEQIVGPQLSRVCVPVAVANDRLVVRATTWAWMRECGRMKRQILERLNRGRDAAERLGGVVVLSPGSVLICAGGRPRGRAS